MRTRLAPLTAFAILAAACTPTAIPFPPPEKTAWRPEGCRTVPWTDPVLGPKDHWRNLHADPVNSDEVSVALAPVFRRAWVAEPLTFNVTGPVFDAAGNLYFAPLFPGEDVFLLSLDPADGSRRWAVPGPAQGGGAGAPMVLRDPDHPGEEIVYVAAYDRALAATTGGATLWDVPTGLPPVADDDFPAVFGANYLPQWDAIVGLSRNGYLFALDRETGAPIAAPFSLPGEPSPARASTFPAALVERAYAELAPLLAGAPPGFTAGDLFRVLLGGATEVANFFAVDPSTGRLWIAATAPDEADGTADGVSDLGALYAVDLAAGDGGPEFEIACRRDFVGGSASSPALRADGTRVYVGDNAGNLIAVDAADCSDVWTLPVGAQLVGSVGVSSDNAEVYVATARDLFQVVDLGAAGAIGWRADLAVFLPGLGQENANLNLYSIAANGIGFQAGSGPTLAGFTLPLATGAGALDRATGKARYFAGGFDETVAVISTGPDGAMYIGNSPVRRAIARALFPSLTPPLTGGISKFAPERLDLLVRDAACAADARAANAADFVGVCPEAAAAADAEQAALLLAQALAAGPRAVADGDLSPADWAALEADLSAGDAAAACAFFP